MNERFAKSLLVVLDYEKQYFRLKLFFVFAMKHFYRCSFIVLCDVFNCQPVLVRKRNMFSISHTGIVMKSGVCNVVLSKGVIFENE